MFLQLKNMLTFAAENETQHDNMSISLVYKNTFDALSRFGNQAWNNKKNSNNNWVLPYALCPFTSPMDVKEKIRV